MPDYRFDLPVNTRSVDDVVTDAVLLGGTANTKPWFKIIGFDKWQYQWLLKTYQGKMLLILSLNIV